MKRDYTNKNKKFYEDNKNKRIVKENEKFLKMDTILLIYMFNHLDELVSLLNRIKQYKETKEIKLGMYIYGVCIDDLYNGEAIIKNNENINKFFEGIEDSTLRGREIYLIRKFVEKGIFEEDDFIKYFEKQYKDNSFLRKSIYELEFEKVLEIASYYPNILKLCSLKTKQEVNELLEILKEDE